MKKYSDYLERFQRRDGDYNERKYMDMNSNDSTDKNNSRAV